MTLHEFDEKAIRFFKKIAVPLARFGLFMIYAWFGFLKIIGQSPADQLVQNLFERTIPWMPFGTFLVLFGCFEVLIGILFLIKGAERIVIPLLFIHMITTFLPLFVLPADTWTAPFVPTLEGQYILKNLALIAAAIGIAAEIQPLSARRAI